MGSNEDASEKPVRQVTVKPFAMGKFPVSVAGMERMRGGKGLRIYGDRKRRCACHKRKLERRKAICRVARRNHSQAVSVAERG